MKKSGILFGVFLLTFFSCSSRKEESAYPVIAPITEAVFASGNIEAVNQFSLIAMNDGYILDVLIKEGDIVNEGQTLILQDNANANIQLQTTDANLKIAQQQASSQSPILLQLEAQLASARQKLETDEQQQERMQRLYASHSVAKVDLDNAKLVYDNSLNAVESIRQNIAATQLTLKQTIINSKSQQQSALLASSYFILKSPGSYKIYKILKKKGEFIRKGEVVAMLGSADAMKIMLNIDEGSITKIKTNQSVLIELNTQKGITHTAKITRVFPLFDEASQAYKAEALFDDSTLSVINGTLLQANIIVARKEKRQ
jgi:multidrug efflux pump subunit AcrA (membrane-fusion protein)